MGLLQKNLIFVKCEKLTRRAGLLERRVYFFTHLNKGGFIREAGLLERAEILERIRYTLKFLMISWASIHI